MDKLNQIVDANNEPSSLLRDLIDQSGDAFIAAQADNGRIIFINEQTCRYFGRNRDAWVGGSITEFSTPLHKVDWLDKAEKNK